MTDENMLPCSVTASAGIFSLRGLIEHLVDAARAVEQRELGVTDEGERSFESATRLRSSVRRSSAKAEALRAADARGITYYNGVPFPSHHHILCGAWDSSSPASARTRVRRDLTFPLEAEMERRRCRRRLRFAPAFDADHAYVPLRTNQLVAFTAEGRQHGVVGRVPDECSACRRRRSGVRRQRRVDRSTGSGRRTCAVAASRPGPRHVAAIGIPAGCSPPTDNGPLVALRASDGEILWQRDLGSPLQAPPAPAGDRVYLPLKDGRLLALSLQTGQDIWTHKLAEAAVGILPVGDRVFVGALDNQLHALNAKDADTHWALANGGGPPWSAGPR